MRISLCEHFDNTKPTIITVSGTHGIESKLGLQIQEWWQPREYNWIHVMQLNANSNERYNKNNVDLNRNVVHHPHKNAHYDALLYATAAEIQKKAKTTAQVSEMWKKTFGENAVQKGFEIMQGQYSDNTKLEFGGYELQMEHKLALNILNSILLTANIDRGRCALIDFHTGVGVPNSGFMLICNNEESKQRLPRKLQKFAKIPYKIQGGVAAGYTEKLGLYLGCAMEFATLASQQLIFANLVLRPHNMPKELFYSSNERWQLKSVTQGCKTLTQIAKSLLQKRRKIQF